MIYAPIIKAALKLWWVFPLLLVLSAFKLPWLKGWLGELYVKGLARLFLSPKIYRSLHNVTLKTPDGTTQIDHIFVSQFGVFVVETKNMRGWIYGGEFQEQWTQKLFKQSFKFSNPLRQNYKHVKALGALLNLPSEALHSVVVFVGECTFKSEMPQQVTRGSGYIRYIRSFSVKMLDGAQVDSVVATIQSGRLAPTMETHRLHVNNVKARTAQSGERKCPLCGSPMVLRAARQAEGAGRQFWGCSTYPRCRRVESVS